MTEIALSVPSATCRRAAVDEQLQRQDHKSKFYFISRSSSDFYPRLSVSVDAWRLSLSSI